MAKLCYFGKTKKLEYARAGTMFYFWRTYDRKEIDLVEETGRRLEGYEIKCRKSQVKTPEEWRATYPGSSFKIIKKENYLDFICQSPSAVSHEFAPKCVIRYPVS